MSIIQVLNMFSLRELIFRSRPIFLLILAGGLIPCQQGVDGREHNEFNELRLKILNQWERNTVPASRIEKFKEISTRRDSTGLTNEVYHSETAVLNNQYFRIKKQYSENGVSGEIADNQTELDAEIELLNPYYHAYIEQRGNNKYVLRNLLNREDVAANKTEFEKYVWYQTRQSWDSVMMSVRWTGLFKSTGFKITGVSESVLQGQKVFVLSFNYDSELHDGPHQHGYNHSSHLDIPLGEVMLLVDYGFLPAKWTIALCSREERDDPFHWEFEANYNYSTGAAPAIMKLTGKGRRSSSDDDEIKVASEWTYDFSSHISLRNLTVSAFGFPEPEWYRPPPPYWFYVSITGMALLVIGALMIRYGKNLWGRG